MKITPIKTEKIKPGELTLEKFLDKYIVTLKSGSIIAISSKVISIIENRLTPKTVDLDKLIMVEADQIVKERNKYGKHITVKCHAFISAAGIDQSNGNDSYVLLPENPQKTAQEIYNILAEKFSINKIGIVICDSRSMPLRAGAMGIAIGFYGFSPQKSYVGREDIFGRKLQFEKANIVDALAVSAVLAMGEGDEQTPIAIIENQNSVEFDSSRPNASDLEEFYISLEEDFFHVFYE